MTRLRMLDLDAGKGGTGQVNTATALYELECFQCWLCYATMAAWGMCSRELQLLLWYAEFPKYSHISYSGASLLKPGQLSTGHIISKNSAPPIIIIQHIHQNYSKYSGYLCILRQRLSFVHTCVC